jgi:hypothetical protein
MGRNYHLYVMTSILGRPERSGGRIEGCGLWLQREAGMSRTPFDMLRTGFDTLLHYALRQPFAPSTRLRASFAQGRAQDAVSQLLRMLN